jgi:hypothetical protein
MSGSKLLHFQTRRAELVSTIASADGVATAAASDARSAAHALADAFLSSEPIHSTANHVANVKRGLVAERDARAVVAKLAESLARFDAAVAADEGRVS